MKALLDTAPSYTTSYQDVINPFDPGPLGGRYSLFGAY